MNKPSSIEVWGGKAVGDKAGMLIEHESLITEYGMKVPPTVVLASESVEHLVKRKLPTEEDFAKTEPSPLAVKIKDVIERFSDVPALAVRSSAAGDARGSGIYDSHVVAPEQRAVNGALWEIGDSFGSEVARNFREQLGLSDEFAIMLQPLVGQLLDRAGRAPYGPALSGTAFSSTPAQSGGYVNVVAGFGGGVDRQGAERITAEELEDLASSYFECYVEMARGHYTNPLGGEPNDSTPLSLKEIVHARAQAQFEGKIRGVSDFRNPKRMFLSYDPDANVLGLAFEDGHVDKRSISKNDFDFDEIRQQVIKTPAPLFAAMDRFKPVDFLATLQKMEQRAGYPFYIEWAATVVGGTIVPWIVQISPVGQKIYQEIEMPDYKQLYYRCGGVKGYGIKTATKIVTCTNPRQVEHLTAYNSNPDNEGYVLIYSSRLTSSMSTHGDILHFSDCDRASVILEREDLKHEAASPIEHLLGAVDLTDKFFGVINPERTDEDMWAALDELPARKWQAPGAKAGPGGLLIREGNFTVFADELNDSLFLGEATK